VVHSKCKSKCIFRRLPLHSAGKFKHHLFPCNIKHQAIEHAVIFHSGREHGQLIETTRLNCCLTLLLLLHRWMNRFMASPTTEATVTATLSSSRVSRGAEAFQACTKLCYNTVSTHNLVPVCSRRPRKSRHELDSFLTSSVFERTRSPWSVARISASPPAAWPWRACSATHASSGGR
jgi:hypothetical protein